MRKSVSKRIRLTKTGKMLRRPMGTDHFRTRKTTKNNRQKRGTYYLVHNKKDLLR